MTEIQKDRSSLGFLRKPRGEAFPSPFNRVQVDENGAVTRYAVNNLNHAARTRGDGEQRSCESAGRLARAPLGQRKAQYIQVGQFAPTHDRNGNLSGMGQWLYRYDAINRLVFASNGTTIAKFFYDAKNRCVARSYQSTGSALAAPGSTLTLNTYDNWNLIEERDGSGAQQARYVHGRKIDEIIVIVNKHGTFYPHHDVLGNVTMLTDRFGRLVERYTYSVTGQVAISDASGEILAESAVGNRWMFTGREWLQEVGLYDYRNRIYSAELGRFIQMDPIRFLAGDVNIYRYCGNGFVSRVDPDGRLWSWAAVFLGAAAGAVSGYIEETVDFAFYGDPWEWENVATSTLAGAAGGAILGAFTGDISAAVVATVLGGAFIEGYIEGAIPDNGWSDAWDWLTEGHSDGESTTVTSITYGPLTVVAYSEAGSSTWQPWGE